MEEKPLRILPRPPLPLDQELEDVLVVEVTV